MSGAELAPPRHVLLAVGRVAFEMATVMWRANDYPGETLAQAWARKYGEPMPSSPRLAFEFQGRHVAFYPAGRVAITGGGLPNDEIRELPSSTRAASTMLEDQIARVGVRFADELGRILFGLGAE
jgi:hypothetical protein